MDVCCSKDEVYYLFHNGHEDQLLGLGNRDFSQLTSAEIDQASLLNTVEEPSGYYCERLMDFLSWLPADYLVNLDRAWDYFGEADFIQLLADSKKDQQIFIKCPVKEAQALKNLQQVASNLSYVAIIESQADLASCLTYDQINLIGVELVIRQADSDLLDPEWQGQLASQGYLLVVNAEKLGADTDLYDNLSDDQALLMGGDLVWGQMLKQDANAIITDWPNFLNDYRQTLKNNNDEKRLRLYS